MTASQMEGFQAAVESVVSTLKGTAILDVQSDNRIWIRVSVDIYGGILTEYIILPILALYSGSAACLAVDVYSGLRDDEEGCLDIVKRGYRADLKGGTT